MLISIGTCINSDYCTHPGGKHVVGVDVEDTEVGSSEGIQNKTGGVQRNEHRYTHLGIEETGVLDDAVGGR